MNKVNARDPQDSILGPLFYSVYIYGFLDNLATNRNFFADDTFPFIIDKNVDSSASNLYVGFLNLIQQYRLEKIVLAHKPKSRIILNLFL